MSFAVLRQLLSDEGHFLSQGVLDDDRVVVLEAEFAVKHVVLGEDLVVHIGDQQIEENAAAEKVVTAPLSPGSK